MDKKKIVTISLFSIFLLLGAVISIAYAYFKANVSNLESSSTISIESGKMSINYEGNTSAITASNIIPNWSTTKKFTLVGINDTKTNNVNTDNNMYYKIGIVVDNNTFSEGSLTYTLNKDSSSSSNGQMADNKTGTIPSSGTKFIATGYFSETSTEVSHIYNLTIAFPDTGEDQSDDQGASFACHVTVEQGEAPKHVARMLKKLYSSKIKTNGVTEDGLEIDATTDKNLRYTGANPKNYISFNDETWRIIGTFNNIITIDEQGNEKTESLVKIVRNDSLGNYSWDSSESSINYGFGVNEWSQADLMYELNCDGKSTKYCRDDITEGYLSNLTTGTTTWYNSTKNSKNGTYDFSKNIKSSWVDKVANVRWNTSRANEGVSALESYNQERSTTLISTPSDNVPRNNTWDGKIALIYPSDYGYASTDTACRNKMNSSTNSVSNCKNENWLFSAYQWTLSPSFVNANIAIHVRSGGYVSIDAVLNANGVRPVLFLKSDVVITFGDGSSTNPYKISI